MNITVRDFLKQYPDSGLDLLTPAGLVNIPPRTGRELLSPGGNKMKFFVCGTREKVSAADLLEQQICKIVKYRNDPWRVFMLVNPPERMAHRRPSAEVVYEQTSFLNE